MLLNRLISFSLIVSLGFLLMVSLIVDTLVTALSDVIWKKFPQVGVYFLKVFDNVLTFCIITALFSIIFKVLPDAKIRWKDVFIGAIVTSLLFMLGKFAIGFYLGNSNLTSPYGAAGSIIVIMTWVYYSAVILYLGAEFTKVYALKFGHRIQPNEYAVFIESHEVEVGKKVLH